MNNVDLGTLSKVLQYNRGDFICAINQHISELAFFEFAKFLDGEDHRQATLDGVILI